MKRIYNSPALQLVHLQAEGALMNESLKLKVDKSSNKMINSEAEINTLGKYEHLWGEDE